MSVVVNPLLTGITNEFQFASKTVTLTGAAGLGAIGAGTVFTVTGAVLIDRILAYCSTNVGVDGGTGAASMQWGHATTTNACVATTTATAIDATEWWHSNAPSATAAFQDAVSTLRQLATTVNIVFEVTSTGTQLVNSGVITWYCFWRPLSPDGNLVAA